MFSYIRAEGQDISSIWCKLRLHHMKQFLSHVKASIPERIFQIQSPYIFAEKFKELPFGPLKY